MSEYSKPPEDSLPPGSPIPPGSSEYKLQKPKKTRKQKAVIWSLAVAAVVATLWYIRPLIFGVFALFIILFSTESHEERYGEIDHVLEVIDYKNSGVILQEGYDGSRHPMNTASFEATIEGEEAFHLFKDRAKALYDYDECHITKESVSCRYSYPSINISISEENTLILMSDI